ncbi:hypothetical protein GALMADRAFT_728899 [Galerina marginata CBS 339.88]|uniref:Uncharacterized protein n=1 Tax=Galerina marginata (strain CBS 339.88) TaxID=685588 RepID=A0A067SQW9_GALM3|nr:hypothetical protein GALMADRAFT_728899 [Galerina marginata CBS 339.88]
METQIFKLDRDVVLDIFLINADMECATEDRFPAVHTLRHTSQVCSAWRDLILSSPSLWARVIDFNFLHDGRWRKEVLNRTGGYSLSVRGGTADQEVVIPFLAENWLRIRCLTLSFVSSSSENFKKDTGLWNLLARPANVLESFQLSLRTTELDYWAAQPIFSPPDFTLFDNQAPLLKSFSAWGINSDIGADWALHLRHLEVSHPTPIHGLLEAFSHLPLLESLLVKERGCHAIVRRDVERSLTQNCGAATKKYRDLLENGYHMLHGLPCPTRARLWPCIDLRQQYQC